MTFYDFLVFLHVLAAAAWFGAALLALLLVELMVQARDRAGVLRLGSYDDRLAAFLFIPSSLLVLAAGFWLVAEGPWSFGDDAWVGVGLGLLVGTFVLGVGLIVPAGKKLLELGESQASDAELDKQIGRLRLLSWIDVAILTAAIFMMSVKPF